MAGDKEQAFDAYHKWLGIPKHQRPPTHYQLLGLSAGESDTEVIEEAAIRQTTHIRAYQVGPHAQACTRILNEISLARQVLSNPQKRKEYDQKLSKEAAAKSTTPTAQQVSAKPLKSEPADNPFGALDTGPDIARRREPARRPASEATAGPSRGLIIGLAAGGGVLVLGIIIAVALAFTSTDLVVEGKKEAPPVKPVPVKPDPKPEIVKPDPVKPDPVKPAAGPEIRLVRSWQTKASVRNLATLANGYLVYGDHVVLIHDPANDLFVPLAIKEAAAGLVHVPGPDDRMVYVALPELGGVIGLEFDLAGKTGKVSNVRFQNTGPVTALAVTSDGQQLIAGTRDGAVQIRNTTNGNVEHTLPRHPKAIQEIAISPDQSLLATVCADLMQMWSLSDDRLVASGKTPSGSGQVAFTPDSQWLVAAGDTGLLRVSASALAPWNQVRAHSGGFRFLAFGPDNRTLATLGPDGPALWEWPTLRLLRQHKMGANYQSMALARDGQMLFAGAVNNNLYAFALEDNASFEPRKPAPIPVATNDPFTGIWHFAGAAGQRKIDLNIRKVDGSHSVDMMVRVDTKATKKSVFKDYPTRGAAVRLENGRLKFNVAPEKQLPFGSRYEEVTLEPIADGTLRGTFITQQKGSIKFVFIREGGPVAKNDPPAELDPPAKVDPKLAAEVLGVWHFGGDLPTDRMELTLSQDGAGTLSMLMESTRFGLLEARLRGEKGATVNGRLRFDLIKDKSTPYLDRFEIVELIPQKNPEGLTFGLRQRDPNGVTGGYVFRRPAVGVAKAPPKEAMKEPPAAARVEPPDDDKIKELRKSVQDNYAKQYAAAKVKPAERASLADTLYELAIATKDDPAGRYVLFCEARDLASQAGKWSVASDAVEHLAREYQVDVLAHRELALHALMKSPVGKEAAIEAAESALQAMGDAIVQDRHAQAATFLNLANLAATKASSVALLTQLRKHETELKTLTQEFEDLKAARETLTKNAGDAAAQLVVGRYLALRKGDWDDGLDALAKAGAGELPELARKDLEKPQGTKQQQDLGDAWWNLADKEKDSAWLRSAYLQRAGHWYRQALPQATGLNERLLSERLKSIEDSPAPLRVATDSLGEVRRFRSHTGGVTSVVVTPDGKRIFSGSLDGTIRSFDVTNTKQLSLFRAPGPVHAFAFSPSQRWLAINGKDSVTVINATTTKTQVTKEAAAPATFWCDRDRLYVVNGPGSIFKTIDVGGSTSGSGPFPIPATAIAHAPDNLTFVTLGNEVRCFSATAFGGLQPGNFLKVPDATCAAFPSHKRWVAVGSSDNKIRMASLGGGSTTLMTLEGSLGTPRCLAVSANGQRILSGGDDKVVRLWDVDTGKELTRYALHIGPVLTVLFAPDGRHAFSGSADGTIRMWVLPRDKK